MKHAEHLRLIPFNTFGSFLVLLFACLTSSVQAASPITGSGLNTQVSPPVHLPSNQQAAFSKLSPPVSKKSGEHSQHNLAGSTARYVL